MGAVLLLGEPVHFARPALQYRFSSIIDNTSSIVPSKASEPQNDVTAWPPYSFSILREPTVTTTAPVASGGYEVSMASRAHACFSSRTQPLPWLWPTLASMRIRVRPRASSMSARLVPGGVLAILTRGANVSRRNQRQSRHLLHCGYSHTRSQRTHRQT